MDIQPIAGATIQTRKVCHMSKLLEAPDNLPGDDLDNVLDENGTIVGRADDTLNAAMPTIPDPTAGTTVVQADAPSMSPERAAHLRMMREVDGNYRDMQRGHFMKRG